MTVSRRKITPSLLSRTDLAERHVRDIAPDLLGQVLRCGDRSGVIVEVEAYEAGSDAASHAHRGPTPRNEVMFGPPGRLYVYRSYGIHWCAIVVCRPEGEASAVLIRAVEPLAGVDEMWPDRPKAKTLTDLASGPGKLCAALGIDDRHDGADLFDAQGVVKLVSPASPSSFRVARGRRIGITKAVERPWRFAVADNAHVSRPRPT